MDLVWINVTANPTAEWVARQITEAFPWDEAPHYLIRDLKSANELRQASADLAISAVLIEESKTIKH